ncbi:ABC transporter ATP-binding protein [Corynebacterium stationis]|uniref:ABC-type quaternary amine transporter n=1 Tax=Corynebacterium stationis TaxID=1705 RepID=A0AB36CID9_9CORY|nr:ABC transporter ATP-binding protein [Corynebacterium stationis]NME88529.1 ABC transporter ATP-binding protein [Corynebacterium stationis]
MSAISLQDLTVTFADGTKGLQNINLEISPHEFIALVGPSGSGKTTLLRTIAGFLHPSQGKVEVGGKDLTDVSPESRGMGMVFQQHAVWPHMSVADNVGYPLKFTKDSAQPRKEKIQRTLELVGLDGFGKRKPGSLSGGQRQRVALARAIIADPTVLLLDEALSALDEPLRDSLRRELVALTKREGLTTVHVTHDRNEALAIADRIVVLQEGRIAQVSTPEELLVRPDTAEVAAFISDATIIPAQLTAAGARTDALGITWDNNLIEKTQASISNVIKLAVLPADTRLVSPGTDGAVPATIESVLFERDRFSITAKAGAYTFRTTSTQRPNIGDQVGIIPQRMLSYPG